MKNLPLPWKVINIEDACSDKLINADMGKHTGPATATIRPIFHSLRASSSNNCDEHYK